MLSVEDNYKPKDRFDVRWMFTSPSRCHLCGGLIIAGDMVRITELEETYTQEDGPQRSVFRAQWHVSCALEMGEQ